MSSVDLDRDFSEANLEDKLELQGFYGDTLKCCPSVESIAQQSDSGRGSGYLSSAAGSSSSLLSFEARITEEEEVVDDQRPAIVDVEQRPKRSPRNPRAPFTTLIMSQLTWLFLTIIAMIRTFFIRVGVEKINAAEERREQRAFVPLYSEWDLPFTKFIFRRLRDILNRPIAGCPGARTILKDRVSYDNGWTFEYPGTTTDVLNLGSYNYLAFAQNDGLCATTSERIIDRYGVGICSSLHEYGNQEMHRQVEVQTAQFLGVEDAICYPMGFGTNTMGIPALVGKDALVLSDELNHCSLIMGCRHSEATTKVFKHNSAADCERKILDALAKGNAKTKRPFSKILILIEGLYSMEGTIAHLKDFVELKKKYKAYLFMDEAHSIGSIGKTGRGVSEYWGVKTTDIDVLMGTFTKSFSAAGGYIAGRKSIIERVRASTHGGYATTLSPPVIQQIMSALTILTGQDGTDNGARRLAQLRINTRHFRRRLKDAGFLVYGNEDSPVVPALIFYPTKVCEFSRRLLEHKIGVVVVGFPATPIATERARFCLSSGHTIEQLDWAIDCIIMEADRINARFSKKTK